MGCKDKMEGYSSMSKKKGEGLKSFNKGFSVPDTYIIIFFVVVLAAIVTFFVPKGYYETQDVTYMMNGVEKTRTVIKDGSFQYLTDDAGKAVTEGLPYSAVTAKVVSLIICLMELSAILRFRSLHFCW